MINMQIIKQKSQKQKKNMITTQKRTKQTTETDYTASKREYL